MSDRRANHLGTQRQHIHIIVFYTLMRGVNIVADRGPDSRHLIGGYGNPHPATADATKPPPRYPDRTPRVASPIRIACPTASA